jgi:predicted nucleic acid-binding protein
VSVLWDTTVLSRFAPDGPVSDYVVDRALVGDPVRVASTSVLEVSYGLALRAPADERFAKLLDWFTRMTAGKAFRTIPLDGSAAIVAGRLRAAEPSAPPKARGDTRSKPMRQASWLLDIQIAATAYAAGLGVATANRRDFELIADVLERLLPMAPKLDVVDPPV